MDMFEILEASGSPFYLFLYINFTCTSTCLVFSIFFMLIARLLIKNGHLHLNIDKINKSTLKKMENRTAVLYMIVALLRLFIILSTEHYQIIYIILCCVFDILVWASIFTVIFFRYIIPKAVLKQKQNRK